MSTELVPKELVRRASDLATPADRAAQLLGPLARRRGVTIGALLNPAPARIDPDRISQVAINLMDNAIRHTPSGGAIHIETGLRNGEAFLSVSDQGPGISDELAPRIFDRFSRGDAARGRGSGGTGLGLAIALAIATAHSGSLTLDERGAQGSRFVLRLPATTP